MRLENGNGLAPVRGGADRDDAVSAAATGGLPAALVIGDECEGIGRSGVRSFGAGRNVAARSVAARSMAGRIGGGKWRALAGMAAGLACLWLAARGLAPGALSDVPAGLRDLAPRQWVIALCATMVSFWALGRYDAVAHRHLRTGLPAEAAGHAGAVAIALSQATGLGLITGALARWRALPGLSAAQAVGVTLFVSVSFMLALAVVIGAASLLHGGPLPRQVALTLLGIAALGAALAVRYPVLRLGKRRLALPSLRAAGKILVMTWLDTAMACLAFHALLPAGAGLGWADLYPVFLLATAAALASGSPGGLGAFELTLLGLLPHLPDATLMTGLVGFRLVYFALPAALAMLALARPAPASETRHRAGRDVTADRAADHPEAASLVQNGGALVQGEMAVLPLVPLGQSLVMLGDPVVGAVPFRWLGAEAAAANLLPCLYKIGPQAALAARRAGWQVLHIAEEAVIDPARHDPTRPAFRQLRRKLRKAEAAGLGVARPAGPLPLTEMAAINRAWCEAHGRERGFSMGRFCPALLARQRVYLARHAGRIVAYVSFHTGGGAMMLDLMRWEVGAPDGTMHALVAAAIEDAGKAGVARLSLAAVPARHAEGWSGRVLGALCGGGLAQFKQSFAPRWQPLYAAAPGRLALAIGLADILRAIHRPTPLAPRQDNPKEVTIRTAG
ncbi:DUF2156 domain-containing protein [Aquicoccus sp. SCR17]|nr:DUF2156 domain-containing protein [Carideicomes alvinocaridis]